MPKLRVEKFRDGKKSECVDDGRPKKKRIEIYIRGSAWTLIFQRLNADTRARTIHQPYIMH